MDSQMNFYKSLYNDLKNTNSKKKRKLASSLRSLRNSLYISNISKKTKIEAIDLIDSLYVDYVKKITTKEQHQACEININNLE